MNKMFQAFMGLAASVSIAGLMSIACFAAPQDKIRIFAHGEHETGGIAYVYRVENHGTGKVVSFSIGAHTVTDADGDQVAEYELSVPPVGWGETDDTEHANYITPSTSITSPAGWTGHSSGPLPPRSGETEEGPILLNFVWTVTDAEGAQAAGIPPGQSLSGFRVLVPRFDPAYVVGRYGAGSNDGKDVDGALLEKTDTTAPILAVRTSPSSVSKASGASLKVQTILTVSDDYDPKPEIKLESITASVTMNQSEIKGAVFGTDDRLFILPVKKDPTGKPVVYTVAYSAMDGTGNKATQSATVTLNP